MQKRRKKMTVKVPTPTPMVAEPMTTKVKMSLWLPRTLQKALRERARDKGQSLNSFVCGAIYAQCFPAAAIPIHISSSAPSAREQAYTPPPQTDAQIELALEKKFGLGHTTAKVGDMNAEYASWEDIERFAQDWDAEIETSPTDTLEPMPWYERADKLDMNKDTARAAQDAIDRQIWDRYKQMRDKLQKRAKAARAQEA